VISRKSIPWERFGFEGVLIVVSILTAFWIDSWWRDVQLSNEQQVLIRQLESEFETNSVLLDERRARHVEMLAASRNLLAVTGPSVDIDALDVSQLKRDLYVMQGWWTYDPQMGVLDGIIQSGKLSVIESNQLRTMLAYWPNLLEDLAEDEVDIANYTRDFIHPLFQREIALRNLEPISETGLSQFSWDVSALLGSRDFENAIQQKFVLVQEVLGYYDDLQAHIDNTLVQIRQEIQ